MSVHKRTSKGGHVSWRYVFDLPGSTRNNRVCARAGGFPTKKAARDAEDARKIEERVRAEAAELAATEAAKPRPATLQDAIAAFLAGYAAKHLAPKTVERYRQMAPYLAPALLDMPLRDVTPLILSQEWERLLERGGRARTTHAARPLSAKTVRNICGLVSAVYGKAILWGLADRNPAEHSDPPRVRRTEMITALSPQQQATIILAATAPWPIGLFLELAAATGARRGEILALRWSDLELVDGGAVVSIARSLCQTKAGLEFKEPKKSSSIRRIMLAGPAVQKLEAWRAEQDLWRERYARDYLSDMDLIICSTDGSPLHPDSVSASVSLLCRRVGLPPGVSLHSLRHTHASHMLAAGVEITAVSARLGHSSPHTTAKVYAHVVSGRDQEAVRKWEQFQQAAMPQKEKVQ